MLQTHAGGGVYCGHREYDELQGRLVAEYHAHGRTYEVIDFAKPERAAVDPDARMKRERLPDSTRDDSGYQARREVRYARLTALLTEHGPMPMKELSKRMGTDSKTILSTMGIIVGNVVVLGIVSQANVMWIGLEGQVIPTLAVPLNPTEVALRDQLRAHGPQTARQLMDALGLTYGRMKFHLNKKGGLFCRVGYRHTSGLKPQLVFGLAGVHDGTAGR